MVDLTPILCFMKCPSSSYIHLNTSWVHDCPVQSNLHNLESKGDSSINFLYHLKTFYGFIQSHRILIWPCYKFIPAQRVKRFPNYFVHTLHMSILNIYIMRMCKNLNSKLQRSGNKRFPIIDAISVFAKSHLPYNYRYLDQENFFVN